MTSNTIFLPQYQIDLGRRLILHDYSWYESHEHLAEKGVHMPLLGEFFPLFYETLSDSSGVQLSDSKQRAFRRRLLRPRDKPHFEWLDAQFVLRDGTWYLHQKHRVQDRRPIPQEIILLEDLLLDHCSVDPTTFSPYGLPLKKKKYGKPVFHYWPPQQDRSVASFMIDQYGAHLLCDQSMHKEGNYIGVRPVFHRSSLTLLRDPSPPSAIASL